MKTLRYFLISLGIWAISCPVFAVDWVNQGERAPYSGFLFAKGTATEMLKVLETVPLYEEQIKELEEVEVLSQQKIDLLKKEALLLEEEKEAYKKSYEAEVKKHRWSFLKQILCFVAGNLTMYLASQITK